MKLQVTSPPTDLAVSLSELKLFLKVDDTSDDTLLSSLIFAATDICASAIHGTIVQTSYSLWMDSWPAYTEWDSDSYDVMIQRPVYSTYAKRYIELPRPPIMATSDVTAFQVYDANGNASDYTGSYYVDIVSRPPRLYLDDTSSPPTPGRTYDGIRIDYTAGYAENQVPYQIRNAIMMVVAYLYHNRGDEQTDENIVKASGAWSLLETAPNRVVRM